MLTRDEAGGVWCPMTRQARHELDDPQAPSGGDHGNLRAVGGCNTGGRGARVPASCRCIADQCAMWRWAPPEDHDGHDTKGYCGLAGRPL